MPTQFRPRQTGMEKSRNNTGQAKKKCKNEQIIAKGDLKGLFINFRIFIRTGGNYSSHPTLQKGLHKKKRLYER